MASSVPGGGMAQPTPPQAPMYGGMDEKLVRTRVLIAAAVMVALCILLGAFFPLWVALCAALAVFLCQKRYPEERISAGQGARIGLRMAAVGFLAILVLGGIAALAEHVFKHHSVLPDFRQQFQQALDQSRSDPQTREMFERMINGNGLKSLLALCVLLSFFFFLVLGAAGGAVQALILRKPRA